MVKLYDKNFRSEDIYTVQPGDVIVYDSWKFSDNPLIVSNYLIVNTVNLTRKEISGQIASCVGVNVVSLDKIVEDEDL